MGQLKNSQALEGYFELKYIPIVIRYATGTPSVVQNPMNEPMALTDDGTGLVTITLTNAAVAPLMVQALALPAAATTLGLEVNLNAAPTRTVIQICVNSGADGATETDPVDLHVLIIKQVVAGNG